MRADANSSYIQYSDQWVIELNIKFYYYFIRVASRTSFSVRNTAALLNCLHEQQQEKMKYLLISIRSSRLRRMCVETQAHNVEWILIFIWIFLVFFFSNSYFMEQINCRQFQHLGIGTLFGTKGQFLNDIWMLSISAKNQ